MDPAPEQQHESRPASRGGPVVVLLVASVLTIGVVATFTWLTDTGGSSELRAHWPEAAAALSAVFVLTTVNLCVRWLRWAFLVRRHHVRLPTRDTFRLFFATLPAVLTPLYVGELVRVAVASRHTPGAGPAMFWSWLIERLSDVGALLAFWGVAAGDAGLLVAGACLLVLPPWALARVTLNRPESRRVHTGQVEALTIVIVCALTSLIAWAMPVIGAWLATRAFVEQVSWPVAVVAFAEGTLLGGLSTIPGGTAVMGSATIVKLIEAGVSPSAATAAVAVLRAGTLWYAVSLGAVLLVVWRRHLWRLMRPRVVQQHFDELAESYSAELPEHIKQRVLERKIAAMLRFFERRDPASPLTKLRGLDVGCGQGWYAAELALRGVTMHAVDASPGQVRVAEAHCRELGAQVQLAVSDGQKLPFESGQFDFAYSINVLHHMPTPEAQQAAFAEIRRVLAPSGVFFLHEMNVENPLFRLYMSYLFPLLRRIDEGTELWVRPSRLPSVARARWLDDKLYLTFLPDFLPASLCRALAPLERWLERSPLRRYSAHYMATLIVESAVESAAVQSEVQSVVPSSDGRAEAADR